MSSKKKQAKPATSVDLEIDSAKTSALYTPHGTDAAPQNKPFDVNFSVAPDGGFDFYFSFKGLNQ